MKAAWRLNCLYILDMPWYKLFSILFWLWLHIFWIKQFFHKSDVTFKCQKLRIGFPKEVYVECFLNRNKILWINMSYTFFIGAIQYLSLLTDKSRLFILYILFFVLLQVKYFMPYLQKLYKNHLFVERRYYPSDPHIWCI